MGLSLRSTQRYIRGTVAYQPEILEINRKFVPKDIKCGQSIKAGPVVTISQGWMGGMTRSSNRAGLGLCRKNCIVVRANPIGGLPSNEQLDQRTNFTKAVRGRNLIAKDLMQISNVQALWIAAKEDLTKTINGISAYGYTISGWVMAVQFAGLKANPSYNANQFPNDFDA